MTTKNSFILMRIRTNANADVDIPRGVRLLTNKVNLVRCFYHGALPAP